MCRFSREVIDSNTRADKPYKRQVRTCRPPATNCSLTRKVAHSYGGESRENAPSTWVTRGGPSP
ncbi:hypothetical protein J6590_070991 [Homalodisca vitripennis]|nr:hypothetical protein J6590_070991 [Homalodisca vitripennis]